MCSACVCVCARLSESAHNAFLILGNQKQIIGEKTQTVLGDKLGTDGGRKYSEEKKTLGREKEHKRRTRRTTREEEGYQRE